MAHVEKRSAGRWRARYRGPDGKERSKTFDRKVDADRWAAEHERDIARGQWIDPKLGETLFGPWAEQWFATTVNLRPSTRARDESYLRTHLMPWFRDRELATIQHLEVRAWVADLTARKAPATVAKAFQILSKIMQAAVDAKVIQASPCANVKTPKIDREEMRFLSPVEISMLADAIHPRYRALVLLGAYGGLRVGELAGLKRHRVDLLHRKVDVAEICVEVRGHLTFGPPKTRAGRRSVAIPKTVAAELQTHLEQWAGDDVVFTSPEGGPLRLPAWRQRAWLPAVRAAGLEPLRPHDLRHTAVALWIAASAQPLEIARRAGHTSVSFCLDRYGHLFDGTDEALGDRLEALMAPAPPAQLVAFR